MGSVVVGLPLNMNGSEGEMAQEVREFSSQLAEQTGVDVALCDERGTTMEANRVMREGGLSRGKRRGIRDGLAAVQILQDYLNNTPKRS